MKKLVSLLIVAMMLLPVFMTNAFAQEEDITISFAFWGDGYEKEVVEKCIKLFAEQRGIKYELAYMPDDYATKMIAMAASNTMPDTGYCPENVVIEWAMNGMIYNLNDLYQSGDLGDRLGQIFRAPNGDILGASIGGGGAQLYYNKAMFDAAGIEYPPFNAEEAWTWDEFLSVAKKLTVDNQGLHPDDAGFNPDKIVTYGVDIGFDDYQLQCFLKSNGGNVISDDGTKVELNSPESIEVLQAISDMVNVHHVAPSPGTSAKDMDMSSAFLSETIAMVVAGTWNTQALSIATKEDGIQFGIGVMPKFKVSVTRGLGTPIVIYKDTKHYDVCVELVKFMLDPNNTIDLMHSGLWLCTDEEWFKNDELIKEKWLVDGVHPENYTEAVIKYELTNLIPLPYYNMAYTNQITDLYIPALQAVWLGNSTVEDAVNSVVPELQKICDRWAEEKAAYK